MSEPSVNAKGRLLRQVGTSDKPAFPTPAEAPTQSVAPPVSIAPPPPAAPVRVEPIFLGDSADGADLLNASQIVQPLAHLCVTPQVQTPFLAAILGPSGAGKTFALRRLAQTIEQLSASSGTASGQAAQRVVLARVDASIGVEAPVAIASAAYAALDRDSGDVDYSGLLDEIRHAGADPHRAASAASDRHDDLVRKLEAERTQRDDVEAKRARLADALAFDTPGSRIDVFARAHRGTIESQLRRFGLAGSDADSSYRNLARDVSTIGAGGQVGVVLRSIWAYGSQARLLLWGVFAFVLAFILRFLHGQTATDAIEHGSDSLKPAGDWVTAHGDWFDRAAQILFLLGALAIALNLWRALGFSNLLLRGARLLTQETRDRRQDLEARAARLNQRVAALTAEADAAAKRAEVASQRAGGVTAMRAPGPEFLEASQAPSGAAREFLDRAWREGRPFGRGGTRAGSADRGRGQSRRAVADRGHQLDRRRAGRDRSGLYRSVGLRSRPAFGGAWGPARGAPASWQMAASRGQPAGPQGRRRRTRGCAPSVGGATIRRQRRMRRSPRRSWSRCQLRKRRCLRRLRPSLRIRRATPSAFSTPIALRAAQTRRAPVMALMQAVAFADDDAQAAMLDRLAYGSGELTDISGPPALVEAVKAARVANNGPISIDDARAAAEIALRYALPV